MKLSRLLLSLLILTSYASAMHYYYLAEAIKTPAHRAAEATEELVNIFNNLGRTALLPNIKKLEELIKNGANVNATNERGQSLLELAIRENYPEGIKLLLAHGANPDQLVTDRHGFKQSILIYVIDRIGYLGEQEALFIIKNLLDHGANPNVKDLIGQPALQVAVQKSTISIVRALLEKGALPNSKDARGNTPLFYIIFENNLEIQRALVQLLTEYGADINALNNNQMTPLAGALRHSPPNNLESVQILLNAGANPNMPRSFPLIETLSRAQGDEQEQIVRALLQAGADPNLSEHDVTNGTHPTTPLEFAETKLRESAGQEREHWERIVGWLKDPKTARIVPKTRLP